MKRVIFVICGFLILSLAACSALSGNECESVTDVTKQNIEASMQSIPSSSSYASDEQIEEWESEMFDRFYSTDGEQANLMFEKIISCIEEQDSTAMKKLFSLNTIDTVANIDEGIKVLFDFYEGEMASYKLWGPASYSSKEYNVYTKRLDASFDVYTTVGVYRIAIRFCTIDSQTPENLGLISLYIIKAEDSNMEYTYWGGDIFNPGITIESEGTS